MADFHAARGTVRFGAFELDFRASELRKQGAKVKLQEQPFQILQVLLQHPGDIVTREELQQKIWPSDTFVDFDHGLYNAIRRLREALCDSAENPRFIEALSRRGYRWKVPVDIEQETAASPSPNSARSSWRGRRAFALAVMLVLVLGGYFSWRQLRARAQSPAGKIMLVVLPFQNLTGDPSQEYFSDGFTEEMITVLGGLQPEQLGVIARTSAMKYKHTDKAVDQIGRELGVQYVLEGSVRRDAGRTRISAQLIQVKDQSHLWAETYQRDLRDIFRVQN